MRDAKVREEAHRDYLHVLLQEVQNGEVVKIPLPDGGYKRESTYPGFMRKRKKGEKWSGAQVARAIELELAGKKLTDKQQEIVDTALGEAKARYERDKEQFDKTDELRDIYYKEQEASGIKDRESIDRNIKDKVTAEIKGEEEFDDTPTNQIEAEFDKLSEEDLSFKPEEFDKPSKKITDFDLDTIEVEVAAVREATGEKFKVKEKGKTAFDDVNKQIGAYEKMLDCLGM